VFCNFPNHGQVNPTLAIIRELVERGEEVTYFNSEALRTVVEKTGAKFQAFEAPLFQHQRSRDNSAVRDNQRLALLPFRLLQTSRQMVPLLLERVKAEYPDCLVYSGLFLWARIIAHALDIPGVALWPTYIPDARSGTIMHERAAPAAASLKRIGDELSYLRETYHIPFPDLASLVRGEEGLTIVFLPRAFQPGGDTFDERYLFVGPSFHPNRDEGHSFPHEHLGPPPLLYISLGTMYNNQVEFYNTCFKAFNNTGWHVILSLGDKLDSDSLQSIPENFVTASYVPQLEVLPQTDVFLSHGGMNSTMESLYFGVPMVIIPHTNEQKMTAKRVEELGLGIALDESAAVTAEVLREAVAQVTLDLHYKERVEAMQHLVCEAGGYNRATDGLQNYVRVGKPG